MSSKNLHVYIYIELHNVCNAIIVVSLTHWLTVFLNWDEDFDVLVLCVCKCTWMHNSWVSLNRNFRLYSSLLNLPSVCHPLIHDCTSSLPEKEKEREKENKRKREIFWSVKLTGCRFCCNSVTSFSASQEEMSCHVACRPSIKYTLKYVHIHTYIHTPKHTVFRAVCVFS